jgi:hypothetical protein
MLVARDRRAVPGAGRSGAGKRFDGALVTGWASSIDNGATRRPLSGANDCDPMSELGTEGGDLAA